MTILAIGYVSEVEAQGVRFSGTTTNSLDSLIDDGIDTTSYRLSRGYDNLLINLKITRGSGTLAGTSILEYSIDNSAGNWKSDLGDTLTLVNGATYSMYWNKTNNTARYWRIRTGGGTTVRAKCVARLQTD